MYGGGRTLGLGGKFEGGEDTYKGWREVGLGRGGGGHLT